VGQFRLPRRSMKGRLRWWGVGAGWVLAAGAAAASLWFPVSVLRAPVVSGLDPDQVKAYAVTTFDAWGGSTTAYTGVGLSFDVPGGSNYAAAIIPCTVLLLAAAALSRRAPGSWSASAVTSVVAPVAAGAMGATAVCQLLAYQAAVRPSPPGGLYGGGEQQPEGELGWSPWLLTAAALIAVATCVLHASSRWAPAAAAPRLTPPPEVNAPPAIAPPEPAMSTQTAPPESAPPDPLSPGTRQTPHLRTRPAADVDPAIFRRPVREHRDHDDPRD
jgi:hypothetical protein